MNKKQTLLLLSLIFVIPEVILILGSLIEGNEHWVILTIKSAILILFLVLYVKGFVWAKWIFSVVLFLSGAIYILGAVNSGGNVMLYLLGFYSLFFLYCIHGLSVLKTTSPAGQQENLVGPNQPNPVYADQDYPVLLTRYKALLIDGLSLLSLMIIVMVIFDEHEYRSTIMITLWFVIGFGYEPLLNRYSRTLGQRVMKIKVRRFDNPEMRISLINSYIRAFIKGTLGWLSFITINFDPHHRAVHDVLSNSIVLEDKPSKSLSE